MAEPVPELVGLPRLDVGELAGNDAGDGVGVGEVQVERVVAAVATACCLDRGDQVLVEAGGGPVPVSA